MTTATRVSLRELPGIVGWSFMGLGYLARLPQAMLPIGMLLLVAGVTDSYAVAGAALALLSLGSAVGGPGLGALADRFGHRRIGLLAATGCAATVSAFVTVATIRPEPVPLCAVALTVGLCNPQTGALARGRWSRLARDRPDRTAVISTAFAYEDVADETAFVLGPALAGLLAAAVTPQLPLLVVVGVCLVAQTGFALHRTAVAPRPVRRDAVAAEPLPWSTLGCLLPSYAAFGMVFGGTQTGLTAVLDAQGDATLAGPVYAVLAFSTATAGLLSTLLPSRFSLHARMLVFATALTVLCLPLPFATSPPAFAVALAFTGLTMAPLGITCVALAERAAPPGRTTTVLTAFGTAGAAGIALGSAVGGQLADAIDGHAALTIPAVGGLVALTGALAARRLVPRERTDAAKQLPTRSAD